MRKRYFLITFAIITIIAGVWVWACKHPFGPGIPKKVDKVDEINDSIVPLTGSGGGLNVHGYTLPQNSLSQEEQDEEYDPDFNKMVLFNGGRKIPAITVSSNGVILATAGTDNGPITVKRSSDMGKTWSTVTVNGSSSGSGYIHPFFINCHNGDILLGVVSNNAGSKTTIIYRGKNDGQNWTVETNINFSYICKDTKECFVTYGQGITLRHGANTNAKKLMFPYFYTNSTNGKFTATMFSENDGETFTNNFSAGGKSSYGNFNTYETKFIELSDGNILLNMRTSFGNNDSYWMKSTDCGKNWQVVTKNTDAERPDAAHADFTRYEFYGKDIKDKGSKYALAIYSSYTGSGYTVKMTTNDFNNGAGTGGLDAKYAYSRELVSESGREDGYPAITVLSDGTIATLTEENSSDIVFRRFNLSWLTYQDNKIDYSKDLKNQN